MEWGLPFETWNHVAVYCVEREPGPSVFSAVTHFPGLSKAADKSSGSEARRFPFMFAGDLGRFQKAFNINNTFL